MLSWFERHAIFIATTNSRTGKTGKMITSCYRWLVLVCLFHLTGCEWFVKASDSVNQPVATQQYTIHQFLDNIDLLGSSFSADGSKILVSSNEGGVQNAHALSVDGRGSLQLTDSKKHPVIVQSYFPHDDRFVYLADRDGDEQSHLYVRELDGSQIDLTPGTGHKARFHGWALDGKSMFISTNERNCHFFDVYEIDVHDYTKKIVFQDDQGYEFHEISADKRYLAFVRTNKREDTDILLYDRQTSSLRNLTPHEGSAQYTHQAFGRDNTNIFYTTNLNSDFSYLVKQNLQTGRKNIILQPEWDVSFALLSHQGKYLVAGVNQDAKTVPVVFDASSMKELELPSLPDGDIRSVIFSRDESTMAFYSTTSRTPPDLYVHDFSGGTTRRLTHSLNPEINVLDMVDAEVVRFTAHDGLQIPGLLYMPHTATTENQVPALIWVHGGPGGQSRIEFRAMIQYLVNHGYAIYAINNRGSSGYGKHFFKADDRKHGQADLDDCVEGKAILINTGHVDPQRIGIMGKSYGGYLTLAAMSFRPDEFAVGIDIFGISNWIRTLQSMPPWWESLRQALYTEIGHPEKDRDYLKSISPLFHADRIVRPLMVLQGANDPRVVKPESDEIVAAVRKNGTPVEYVLLDDEGHSFVKKKNRLVAYRAILSFLDRYLKPE